MTDEGLDLDQRAKDLLNYLDIEEIPRSAKIGAIKAEFAIIYSIAFAEYSGSPLVPRET